MDFAGIIGNDEIKKYLLQSVKEKRLSQSYLFVGVEGIGKLMIAKEFARKILCLAQKENCQCKSCQCFEGFNHPDYCLVNENGETIKIEQIREITNKVIEQPIIGTQKVYIINDADKMTLEAQNCLLKTLEEPPEFVILLLIASNQGNLLSTIKSRCMTLKFKSIPKEELRKYATDKLGITQMTENLLKSFNGSIGKANIQKENQEKFSKIEQLIHNLKTQNVVTLMNDAKVIYDKENIMQILEYMMICTYTKAQQDRAYLSCIEKINLCMQNLKRNCNFDMTLDTMLFEMKECLLGKE